MDKPESLEGLCAGRHSDREVIILRVRWYLRFRLSLRDLISRRSDVVGIPQRGRCRQARRCLAA